MLGLTRDVGEDPFEPRARARSTAVAGRVSPPAARVLNPNPTRRPCAAPAPVPCARPLGVCPWFRTCVFALVVWPLRVAPRKHRAHAGGGARAQGSGRIPTQWMQALCTICLMQGRLGGACGGCPACRTPRRSLGRVVPTLQEGNELVEAG